jgi:hypothetical protein
VIRVAGNEDDKKFDGFVKDAVVAKELSVSLMSLHRWDHDPKMAALGWPAPVRLNKSYKFRPRAGLEEFKRNMIKRAIVDRDQMMKRMEPAE